MQVNLPMSVSNKQNKTKHEQTCATCEQLDVTIIHAYIIMDLKLICLLLYRRTARDPSIVHSFMKYSCTTVKAKFDLVYRNAAAKTLH